MVFEGGNATKDAGGNTWQYADLSLLSTAADFLTSPFCTMVGTSPATALAARMAAQIQAAYPRLWPETVRGLMVHSAEWTAAMKATVTGSGKRDAAKLLRNVGYGVPGLTTALGCAASRATMLVEAEMQPYMAKHQPSAEPSLHELHAHTLPWPREALMGLPFVRVRMRVTLSYFVEPNPGNRGYTSTYRYASCQLRFRVSKPGQQLNDLVADVDKNADAELGDEHVEGDWNGWVLDASQVFKGSIHSNWWEGSAADLASMNHIIVFPVTGWWKKRKALGRGNSKVRYSLIVTLETVNPALDLYTEIANVITPPVPVIV